MPLPVTKATRLAELYARIEKINLPLVKPARKFSSGSPDSPLMIVFGHALTDIQGGEKAYLLSAFAKVELTFKEVFCSYAIRGSFMRAHEGNLILEHREARAEEIETSRPFLIDEINIVRPRCVLCVGGTAIKTLLGDPHFSVVRMAGAEIDAPGIHCPVIATVSFTYVLRTGGARSKLHSQFIGDLAHAKALSLNSEI